MPKLIVPYNNANAKTKELLTMYNNANVKVKKLYESNGTAWVNIFSGGMPVKVASIQASAPSYGWVDSVQDLSDSDYFRVRVTMHTSTLGDAANTFVSASIMFGNTISYPDGTLMLGIIKNADPIVSYTGGGDILAWDADTTYPVAYRAWPYNYAYFGYSKPQTVNFPRDGLTGTGTSIAFNAACYGKSASGSVTVAIPWSAFTWLPTGQPLVYDPTI